MLSSRTFYSPTATRFPCRHSSIPSVRPIESCLNMNPIPTRTHISHRNLQIRSTHLGQLKLYNDNFTPTMSLSHLRTPSPTRTPTPNRIPISTNTPTRSRIPNMTRRAQITPRCTPCPCRTPSASRTPTATRTPSPSRTKVAKNYPTRFLHILMHQVTP